MEYRRNKGFRDRINLSGRKECAVFLQDEIRNPFLISSSKIWLRGSAAKVFSGNLACNDDTYRRFYCGGFKARLLRFLLFLFGVFY